MQTKVRDENAPNNFHLRPGGAAEIYAELEKSLSTLSIILGKNYYIILTNSKFYSIYANN